MNPKQEILEVFLMSFCIPANGDTPILLIGHRPLGSEVTKIVNSFSGDEAIALYEKITKTTLKREEGNNNESEA